LQYVNQILLEALRLYPTAPAFGLYPYEDEIVGGKYKIKKGTFTTVLTLMLHRDKSVWGDDPEAFNPDHFTPEAIAARPPNSYKPFGNGQRACIGRQFAMQEAILVIGMILQRFELIDHKNYQMELKESLSIKPDGLSMKVKLRRDIVRSQLVPGALPEAEGAGGGAGAKVASHGTPATVLYGSNLGSTEDFARGLARTAEANGFDVRMDDLDSAVGALPKEGAVLIACSSYNGAPPDNAAKFVDWIEGAEAGSLDGVRYAVFGCGHSDWATTFQATPRMIDERMAALGATRIADKGEGDAREDIEEQFDVWSGGLWPQLAEALDLDFEVSDGDVAPLFEIEELGEAEVNPLAHQTGARNLTVTENRELQNTDASGRSTRHIEVSLDEGMTYRTGDHLSVVPINSNSLVGRVLRRFGYSFDSQIRIRSSAEDHSKLPVNVALPVHHLLSRMMELQDVASRKDVATLAKHTECPMSKPQLEALAGDDYKSNVQVKRRSVLDLLEDFPACELPFGVFLELMPMMQPRYYSISSSGTAQPDSCTVTVGVVDEPHLSGDGQFTGVCSNYLARARDGQIVQASLRSTDEAFRLPEDPNVPVIMIGPGTGIAPFRGFCQERAHRKAAGDTLGAAMLFFGCRHPDQDFIYREELEGFADSANVDLHVAFSRAEKRKVYVQDVLRDQAEKVWELLEAGAKVFVCGDGGRMEPDVRRALTTIYAEENDTSTEAAEAWMESLVADGRYVLDVWASV
ncbi:MAG: cytochrome P450, partial [Pseudomonadota bacterium]